MKIRYDAKVDAPYIRFLEITVTTQHVAEGIAVGYAAGGRIAGIGVLDTRKRFGCLDVFRRVILEDFALAAPFGTNKSGRYEKSVRRDHDLQRHCEKRADGIGEGSYPPIGDTGLYYT